LIAQNTENYATKKLKPIEHIKEKYKIGHVLGSGSFGSVRICLHRKANVKCAIKIIEKKLINKNNTYSELL